MNGTLGQKHAEEADDAFADAKRMGLELPADAFSDLQDGVWPENCAAVHAFLAVSSQWRHVGMGHAVMATGLDYCGVEAGLRMAGIATTAELLGEVQVIEFAARAAMNEVRR